MHKYIQLWFEQSPPVCSKVNDRVINTHNIFKRELYPFPIALFLLTSCKALLGYSNHNNHKYLNHHVFMLNSLPRDTLCCSLSWLWL
jgi:hypothetical protein